MFIGDAALIRPTVTRKINMCDFIGSLCIDEVKFTRNIARVLDVIIPLVKEFAPDVNNFLLLPKDR